MRLIRAMIPTQAKPSMSAWSSPTRTKTTFKWQKFQKRTSRRPRTYQVSHLRIIRTCCKSLSVIMVWYLILTLCKRSIRSKILISLWTQTEWSTPALSCLPRKATLLRNKMSSNDSKSSQMSTSICSSKRARWDSKVAKLKNEFLECYSAHSLRLTFLN